MAIKNVFSMSSRTGRESQRYNAHGCRQVVGCIPYRYKKFYQSSPAHGSPVDELEFLLVSSQKSPRMMFPKGGWEQDETLEEAASRETFEEAGVLGEAENCLGTWYFKSKSIDAFHEGFMLPFFVKEELDDWPERDVRLRLWVSYKEAMEGCFHPWMKEALDVFVSQLTCIPRIEKELRNETLAILAQGLKSDEATKLLSEEEDILMSGEPRIDMVYQSMQSKEDVCLRTVCCIEMMRTDAQTVGRSVDESMQLKVEEQRPWNALLIKITIGSLTQHLQRKEELQDASGWGLFKEKPRVEKKKEKIFSNVGITFNMNVYRSAGPPKHRRDA